MAGPSPNPSSGAFESHQSSRSNSTRRARPPNIMTCVDENGTPPRSEAHSQRVSKRESRVGLKSLFGRSKVGKEAKEGKESGPPSSASPWDHQKPGGLRASLAEISNWPSALHSQRSESSLDKALPPRPTPSPRKQPAAAAASASPWSPPPLFQVYPQAVKHDTLPACTAPMDTLLRLHGHRGNPLARADAAATEVPLGDEAERSPEKLRRRPQRSHSRNVLDWTAKVYVLVTSGYLLQYAAEGPFDRLPEKMLQLTKDSAAFASDLIPGKHWVLQVSSTMEADGTPSIDSRSLFSKFSLRSSEKKQHVSNFLMVFESAPDMESWLATIRRAIELLGGKKKLTETGKPKGDDDLVGLRSRPSDRTLVIRDPARFTNATPQDFSWSAKNALGNGLLGDSLESLYASELNSLEAPELSLDDISTTESHYSSDGQRLDSLRDSGNRLSFISSGARTVITSAGSSPACSPMRPSFSSNADDAKCPEIQPDCRLRPSAQAQAIANRRQSMQTTITPHDARVEATTRPHSAVLNPPGFYDATQVASNRQSVPNFSRRSSGIRNQFDPISDQPQAYERESHIKPTRKTPPTALALSRPLSIVVDQPSPLVSPVRQNRPQPQRPDSPRSPSLFSAWVQNTARTDNAGLPSRNSSLTPDLGRPTSGRYVPQTSTFFNDAQDDPGSSAQPGLDEAKFILPTDGQARRFLSRASFDLPASPRSFLSMDNVPSERRLSTGLVTTGLSSNRASVGSLVAETPSSLSARHSFANLGEFDPSFDETAAPFLPRRSSKRATCTPLMAKQQPNANGQARGLFNRQSLPQLAEIPPPSIPPPTCALPPIPTKHRASSNGISTDSMI